jgi:hypothetical protein
MYKYAIFNYFFQIAKRYDLRPTPDAFTVKPFVRTVLTLGDDLPVEFLDR